MSDETKDQDVDTVEVTNYEDIPAEPPSEGEPQDDTGEEATD